MFEFRDKAIIKKVILAILVPAGNGVAVHNDRPTHGLVMNLENGVKDYTFSDGTILHTHENELFYLPKGSSYRVTSKAAGACYAINFELMEDIDCRPFTIKFRNHEPVLKCFTDAVKAWTQKPSFYNTVVLKNLYEIINLTGKELECAYLPTAKEALISEAVDEIHKSFTRNDLTISELAAISDISETYFRRLFTAKYGMSPKEYITKLRIDYAKRLLKSGDFSVSEVAQLSGYYEPCHFSREFSKHTGLTPKAYKNVTYTL